MAVRYTRAQKRAVSALAVGLTAVALQPAQQAQASYTIMCVGFSACSASGYSHYGYATAYTQSWWGQWSGHNCTNYAAYRLAKKGVGNPGINGNAGAWGSQLAAKGYAVNSTPVVGSVGWYAYNSAWAPGWGHVSIVESVTPTTITLSEDSITGNGFRYRTISRSDSRAMPTGFIHVADGAGAATPTAATKFADVYPGTPFATEIGWVGAKNISNGWVIGSARYYRPVVSISREAMAAFIYRYAGSPAFAAPARSPFVDVTPSSPFYKEIAWLESTGITNGWAGSGGAYFKPQAQVSREAMAAFLYRVAGSPAFTAPAVSPFKDLAPSAPFYKEITWLAAKRISTGYQTSTGAAFGSALAVQRNAMAAFLYRQSAATR